MSGDHDRASSKPSADALFGDAGGPRALPRARRQKPPPGIITAGGVDMARAHASGIVIRAAGAAVIRDEPRVVIAVRADARKVPTRPRLGEARAGDTRAPLLPATPSEATSPPSRRSDPAPRGAPVGAWISAGFAIAIVAVAAASTHRILASAEPTRVAPRVASRLNAIPRVTLPPPTAAPIEAAHVAALSPVDVEDDVEPEAPRPPRHAPPPRPKPPPVERAASAKPGSDFVPPFELPAEKKRD